jgi:thiol-disulfide isomerase/thioredoxin
VNRLPRPARCGFTAAGGWGQPGSRRPGPARAVLAAAVAATALAVAGCGGGAIGANTPLSSGQSFVGGSYQTTVFKTGSRPVAPAVSGTTISGSHLSLASYRGDVVVLNFWGSWCAPCRAEAPALGTLARQMEARGVRFVGIDIRDEPDAARAFMQNFNIGYPSINDPGDDIALLFRGTDPPSAIPSTIIIDRRGRIAARVIGSASYASLKSLISTLAAERS